MAGLPDKPSSTRCQSCHAVISWLFSARHDRWIPFVGVLGQPDDLRRHRCAEPDRPAASWRQAPAPFETPDPAAAVRARRGAALVSAAISAKRTTRTGGPA